MAVKIQSRRGTAAQWTSTNPTLSAGEFGFETDTLKLKIGNGSTAWTSLAYTGTTATEVATAVSTAISNLVDAAPGALDTLNELAAAIGDDANFFATIATNLSNHEADTTSIHGISNTANLVYNDNAALTNTRTPSDGSVTTAKIAAGGIAQSAVTSLTTDLGLKAPLASPALTGTPTAPTAGSGTNTTQVATTAFVKAAADSVASSANSYTDSSINALDTDDIEEGTTNKYFTDGRAVTAVGGSATNTPDTLVKRDAEGDFAARIITATLDGNVVSANLVEITSDDDIILDAVGVYIGSNSAETNKVTTRTYVDGIQENLLDIIDTHELDTSTHGVTEIVGTTETQTLSNKTFGSDVLMDGNQISGLGTPTQADHAATKSYVDGVSEGLNVHEAARVATTANVTIATGLEAGDTIDGVVLVAGDRVLVKNQTTSSQNGIYVVQASGAATRALDFDTNTEIVSGDFVFVSYGTENASTGWTQTASPAVIGSDPILFTQFSGAGTYLAGNGLVLDGTTFEIDTDITSTKTYADGVAATALADAIADTQSRISTHNTTLNIHGIANTAELATKAYADSAAATEATSAVFTHDSDTTNVHGISNTANLVYNDNAALTNTRTPSDGSVTTAKISLDGIAQSAITGLTTDLGLKAPLDSPTFTGTVTLPANTISQSMMGDDSVGTNEIGGLAVTEEKIANGAVTSGKIANDTIVNADINTAAAIDWTKLAISSTVSSTEIGYVDGVTSAIQTQLNAKAPLASPTFTGTTTTDDLIVDGDLTVNGTNFAVSATTITIEDNIVQLAHNQAGNVVDLGLVVAYNDGTYQHAGIVRDVSENTWKLFKGVETDPTTTVNFSEGVLDDLALAGLTASSATIGDVSNTELQYLNGVTSAVQTQLDAKANIAAPTFTGLVTVAANGVAFTDATQTKAGVPSISTFVTKTGSYTVGADSGLAERDLIILVDSTSTAVISIPTDATTNFPVGTSFDVIRLNTGALSIAAVTSGTTSVVATPGLNFRARYSSVTCLKIAANSWIVYGDLAS
jgi:hypothetical protein